MKSVWKITLMCVIKLPLKPLSKQIILFKKQFTIACEFWGSTEAHQCAVDLFWPSNGVHPPIVYVF